MEFLEFSKTVASFSFCISYITFIFLLSMSMYFQSKIHFAVSSCFEEQDWQYKTSRFLSALVFNRKES